MPARGAARCAAAEPHRLLHHRRRGGRPRLAARLGPGTPQFRGKAIAETLVDLPIVLPPTVAGLALLLAFGRRGRGGTRARGGGPVHPLHDARGRRGAGLRLGTVLHPGGTGGSAGRGPRPRGSGRRRRCRRAPRWSGASPSRSPRLPSAAGLVLSWARALGEFGATIMFAGNVAGRTRTLPLLVYAEFQDTPGCRHRRGDRVGHRRDRRAVRGAADPLARDPGGLMSPVRDLARQGMDPGRRHPDPCGREPHPDGRRASVDPTLGGGRPMRPIRMWIGTTRQPW